MAYLHEELEELKKELIKMASHVESLVKDTFLALENGDSDLLNSIIEREDSTNEMEKSIEDRCLRLLVTLNPRAKDFRLICSILKMITDYERIGDQTYDIAEIQLCMKKTVRKGELPLIESMYMEVIKMLKLGMDAFIYDDENLAKKVGDMDDVVDEYYLKARKKVVEIISGKREDAEEALDLMQIVKYVERIGDHAENIAEWAIYKKTGLHPNLKRDMI